MISKSFAKHPQIITKSFQNDPTIIPKCTAPFCFFLFLVWYLRFCIFASLWVSEHSSCLAFGTQMGPKMEPTWSPSRSTWIQKRPKMETKSIQKESERNPYGDLERHRRRRFKKRHAYRCISLQIAAHRTILTSWRWRRWLQNGAKSRPNNDQKCIKILSWFWDAFFLKKVPKTIPNGGQKGVKMEPKSFQEAFRWGSHFLPLGGEGLGRGRKPWDNLGTKKYRGDRSPLIGSSAARSPNDLKRRLNELEKGIMFFWRCWGFL